MAHGISEFCKWLGAQIGANASVTAFCSAHGWSVPTVQFGQDSKESLVDAAACPKIIMIAGNRSLSDDFQLAGFTVRLGICCHDAAKAETSGVVTYYPGYDLSDQFTDIVRGAINTVARSHSSGYYVAGVPGGGPDDSIDFPFYRTWLGVQVQLDSDLT